MLAPKKKKTQVLATAAKRIDDLSAHSCIAEFEGIDEGGAAGQGDGGAGGAGAGAAGGAAAAASPGRVARFKIERYLRYAHLFPELASGLLKKFELRLDTADAQTSILAEETTNTSLAEYVTTGLAAGDRVELEWRQIRVETDTDVEEDRFLIAEQCIKLAKLDAGAEAALLARWPEPQIMIRKPQGKAKAAAGGKAAAAAKKKEKKKGKKGKKKGKKGRRK